jgi:NTE family protein
MKLFNRKARRIAGLKSRRDQATSYEQWREIALELDELEGFNAWKRSRPSEICNCELLEERLLLLQQLREQRRLEELKRALREGLHHDLGNMGDVRLYQHCHYGTLRLIEDYVEEVCRALNFFCDTDIPGMNASDKIDFFKAVLTSFGRPALLLSGGASLGMFHVGVVKALWERGLLPDVITGSSAGSIVAAILGTHDDEELPALFEPSWHKIDSWRWLGVMSGLQGRGFMDQRQLKEFIRVRVGDFTFQEAYEKTGRSINITVSPVQHNQKPRLLSAYTSPYLLLWSAALASSSVPLVFPPVRLMKKDIDGSAVSYMPKLRWVDGSVVSDLPKERLMHLYDVNYTIVSQTNPHVVPFLTNYVSGERTPLLKIPSTIIRSELRFHGRAITDYIRRNADSSVIKQMSGQLYSMMTQTYFGDITIAPKYGLRHYTQVMSNLDQDFIAEMILAGERATWPRLAMVRTHAKISKTLERCIACMKQEVRTRRATLTVIA